MEKIVIMCNTYRCKRTILEQLKDFDIEFINNTPVKGLSIDSVNQRAFYKGNWIILTLTEYRILELLFHYPEKIISRNYIKEHAFNGINITYGNISVQICRLRKKINRLTGKQFIRPVPGKGYSLI